MAHLSDPTPSSIFSESIDQFSIIPSDSFSFEPTEPTEPTDSQLTEPIIYQLPQSIERVGDRTKD
jgi:hypothetical protein